MNFSAYLIPLVVIALALAGFFFTVMRPYAPPTGRERDAQDDGPFVAEVWLEWEICTGSTLYRQRFSSEKAAERAVRSAAAKLDAVLPTHYVDIDWSGRRVPYKYEYEIRFGVRRAASNESTARIWSPALPGTQAYSGEHATAHPLLNLRDSVQLSGYKV